MSRRSVKPTRLYQQVAEKLMQMIAAGTYKPGDRLPAERDLATTYAVSRPTIREAIIALELDGMVEVKVGSGVYVSTRSPTERTPVEMDVGAFELTEARLLIEGEVAALAATMITDGEVAELDGLLVEMANQNEKGRGEIADRRFHQVIAKATRNSAMSAVIELLWNVRTRSPQCVRSFQKSRDKGYLPVVREHQAIIDALRNRDPVAARAAMRDHLNCVLNYLLDATEIEAIEEAKAKVAAQRNRFSRGTGV